MGSACVQQPQTGSIRQSLVCTVTSTEGVVGEEGESSKRKGRRKRKEGGEGGREDEGAACSSLIPSNIPLDDRAWSKER